MIYLELFLGFLKVGLFSFGGAYGAIPLIRDVVLSYGWMDDEMVSYMIAVSESTPGPIMVNMATYVGSNQAGFIGACLATLAVVLPSFIVILLVTALLKTALKNKYVAATIRGLKPCVIGIVLATGLFMLFGNLFGSVSEICIDIRAIIICAALVLAMVLYKLIAKKKLSPVMLIILSAAAGIATTARTLPLICTGISMQSSTVFASS